MIRLSRRIRSQRTDESVTLTQLSALYTLASCRSMTPSELAASERVRPPSMTRVIASLEEARDYLAHPVLGPRLVECAQALADLPGDDPVAVLGSIDAVKLRSSMTLFAAAGGGPVFRAVLDRYFAGEDDPANLARL